MKTVEVLYNQCYGGFSLSKEAVDELNHTYGWKKSSSEIAKRRHDPRLISLFKEKGSKWMSGECSELAVLNLLLLNLLMLMDIELQNMMVKKMSKNAMQTL